MRRRKLAVKSPSKAPLKSVSKTPLKKVKPAPKASPKSGGAPLTDGMELHPLGKYKRGKGDPPPVQLIPDQERVMKHRNPKKIL